MDRAGGPECPGGSSSPATDRVAWEISPGRGDRRRTLPEPPRVQGRSRGGADSRRGSAGRARGSRPGCRDSRAAFIAGHHRPLGRLRALEQFPVGRALGPPTLSHRFDIVTAAKLLGRHGGDHLVERQLHRVRLCSRQRRSAASASCSFTRVRPARRDLFNPERAPQRSSRSTTLASNERRTDARRPRRTR